MQDATPPFDPAKAYAHPAALPIEVLLEQCEMRRQRRSGPGGQHRNKVETAIVLVHVPSGIRGEASERRSQAMNQKMAIQRLRIKLALELRTPPKQLACEPSPLWCSRLQGKTLVISASHADFPPLLAEALDVVTAREFDCKQSGILLGCSSSQLVKFLKLEPEALLHVNQERQKRGLRPLR